MHTWNLATNDNGTGILIEAHSIRLLDVYLDYNDLVLTAPIFMIDVENTFFLGGGTLVLKANAASSEIQGLNVMNSIYSIGNFYQNVSTIELDEAKGKFTKVENMIVKGIQMNEGSRKYSLKTSSTKRSMTLMNATKWVFDFSDVLLFENIGIQDVDYTMKMDEDSVNKFVQSSLTINEKNGNAQVVTIMTDKPCDATVYVNVDQSVYDPALKMSE